MGRGSAPSGASKDERPGCLDTLAATAGPSPFEARRRGSHLRVTVMECARRFSIVFASVAKQSRNFPRRQSGLLRCARNDEIGAGALNNLNCHRPRKRAIQYSETVVIDREAAAYWVAQSSRATTPSLLLTNRPLPSS